MSSFTDAPFAIVYDDDAQWAVHYATKLIIAGFRVEETTSESELDRLVHSTPRIDLFVCDTQLGFSRNMPRGYELCCLLRDRALMPTAYVIGISSRDFSEQWGRCNFEFFSKSPVGQEDFEERVQEVYREIMGRRRGF
ncbi:hypothetical protein AUJ84_01505 [Candidatus Pacearchaeota archaeon CG1_02_32_132]|nr:MAG: hypothetical protein AUJ84_01505 [Candidatus Pacearchaeota archaeon CG1_02_32_132]